MDPHLHRTPLAPTSLVGGGDGRGATGRLGEDLAVRHLVDEDGCQLVARNWRLRTGQVRGELDVIALDPTEGCVVVCEVKTRRDAARFGGAVAALSPRQHARLRALTAAFLRDAQLPYRRVRLDLIAIDLGRTSSLTHLVAVW